MKVYLFKPRFARLVEAGTKRTTIRPKRNHPTKVGDLLSLREWTGNPYRSKHRVLAESVCKETKSIWIGYEEGSARNMCKMGNLLLTGTEWDEIAKIDGFIGWEEMYCWFSDEHGIPFEGEWIRW